MTRHFSRYLCALFCCASIFGFGTAHAEQVVVYSARIEQLIKPMFDAFTKDTGVGVKFVTDKEGALLARLKAEGKNTPADLLITSSRLAHGAGVFQSTPPLRCMPCQE